MIVSRYLCQLRTTFEKRNIQQCHSILENIVKEFKRLHSAAAIEISISDLFTSNDQDRPFTLINFIEDAFIDSDYKNCIREALVIIDNLLCCDYKLKLDSHIKQIVYVCLKILKSACISIVKESSLKTLIAIADGPWPDEIESIIQVLLLHFQNKNETPTIMSKEFQLAGLLCRNHPEIVVEHSEYIGKSIVQVIEDYSEGKAKISFPLLEGCFIGIDSYLYNFNQPYEIIYKGMKSFSDSKDQHRKGHVRAIFGIISNHGGYFKDWLKRDRKYWHPLLLQWINKSNSDDRKAGCKALLSYYEHVGTALRNGENDEDSRLCLQYFMLHFKKTFSDKHLDVDISFLPNSREVNIMLKGFATFISNCKNLFNEQEFVDIAETITQRALMFYLKENEEISSIVESATEESTEKIEELCNHVEALAVINMNFDKNLELLVFTIISDLQKCLPHRRYIIQNAVKKALSVINIQLFTSFFINESCKHFVSSSLYWNKNSTDNENLLLTYEIYMPLWEYIIKVDQNGDDVISKYIFDEFMTNILKIIPYLDLNVKNIPLSEIDENDLSEDNLVNADVFETPLNPNDYMFFTNVSDLMSSILSLKWTHPWFIKWLEPSLSLVFEGRKKFPNAVGYLKIFEAILKIIKSLKSEKLIGRQYLMRIEGLVVRLIKELSATTTNRAFQIRASLTFLQIPPEYFKIDLMKNAIDAVKAIFMNGKADLNMAIETLNILEEWDGFVSREMFNTLCREILPILNEHLCSSGVSETYVMDKTKISSNSKKKHIIQESISPQLTVFQHKIMIFLGKVDSFVIKSLLSSINDNLISHQGNKKLNRMEHFKLALPCLNQQELSIHLDKLIPRIKQLALHSSNRDTRITACQTMHSIILIMYGIDVTLPISQRESFSNIQSDVFTTLLYLAADQDEAVSKMFVPLIKQTCHWLSIIHENASNTTNIFLSSLFEGACNSNNNLIQMMACESINEFIKWSIKTSSNEIIQRLPQSISFIVRTICQKMLYPNDHQKYVAYLVFEQTISQLYKIENAMDKYLLELLYSIVKSIESTYDKRAFIFKCSNTQHDLSLKVLNIVLKCIHKKLYMFTKSNENRRKPPGFNDTTVFDICNWLLSQMKSICRPMAEACFKAFIKVCTESTYKTPKCFIEESMKTDMTVMKYFKFEEVDDESETDPKMFLKNIYTLYTTFDIYVMLLKHDILPVDCYMESLPMMNTILEANDFLLLITRYKIDNIYNVNFKIFKETFENMLVKTMLKYFDCVPYLVKLDVNIANMIDDKISKAIITWIFEDIIKLTAFKRNVDQHKLDCLNNLKTIPQIWKNVEVVLIEQLTTIFAELNREPELKSKFDYLDIINGLHLSTNTETLNIDIVKLFKFVFVESVNSNILISCTYDPVVNSFGKILSFYMNIGSVNGPLNILTMLTDGTLMNSGDSIQFAKIKNISLGEWLFTKFKQKIGNYIVNNSEIFFTNYKNNINKDNVKNFAKLMEQILEFSSGDNIQNDNYFDHITACLIDIWSLLLECNMPFEQLIHLCSLLVFALPNSLKFIGMKENTLNRWIFDSLQNENLSLRSKVKLILLLPVVMDSGNKEMWYSDLARNVMDHLYNCLPQSCYEFKNHTKERAEYLSVVNALLESMANSGSYVLLDCIIKCTVGDRVHLYEKQIAHKLRSFCLRLTNDEQLDVLNNVSKILNSCSDSNLLYNIINRFYIPLLSHSSVETLQNFFAKEIVNVFKIIKKDVPSNASQYLCEKTYIEWIYACKFIDVVFSKMPFNTLNSIESKIINQLQLTNSESFVKEVFIKIFKLHKANLPPEITDDSTKEFLRLSHCAAYKCLYTITVARPQEEIKAYTFLLNPKGSNLESMIDFNKNYEFPLEADQGDKYRSYAVPIKKQNSSNDWFNSSTIQNTLQTLTMSKSNISLSPSNSRQQSLKQTLTDNILSFDMNHAVIGDRINIDVNNESEQISDVVNQSLDLVDDDLNNHECMAVLCQLVKNLDRLSESEDSPEWLQCITDVLSDRSRHRNVRLFVVKMVDNVRSIFKRHAKSMLNPLLSVIKDRCTSFNNKINFLDICLITTLLSWEEIAKPQHSTEKHNASLVLRLIVDHIDPSTQEPEVFKHSLELLKNIIAIWGPSLTVPYDLLVNKLDSTPELKKAAIQINATFLLKNIPTWQDTEMFENYKKSILECLRSDDKSTYKSASEVVGLTLKVLMDSRSETINLETDSMDVDDGDYAMNFLKQVREILAKLSNVKRDVFMDCLYGIQKYFVLICNETLLSKILHLIVLVPNKQKTMSFKVLLDSMNVFDKNTLLKELKGLGLTFYINNINTRLFALHILNKAFDYYSITETLSLIENINLICDKSVLKDVEHRTVIYEILMKIYDELCKTPEDVDKVNKSKISSRKRTFSDDNKRYSTSYFVQQNYSNFLNAENRRRIKYILLRGLNDEDVGLKNKMNAYWSNHFSSCKFLHDRWMNVLQEFLGDEIGNDCKLLSLLKRLIFSTCEQNDNFKLTKLFNQPLEICEFVDYIWNDGKPNDSRKITPAFAETLNTQLLTTSLLKQRNENRSIPTRMRKNLNTLVNSNPKSFYNDKQTTLRNTLESLSISLTNTGNLENERSKKYESGFDLGSSLLFTIEPELIHRRPQPTTSGQSSTNNQNDKDDFEKRLRKKLVANKNLQMIKFSGIAAKRKTEQKQRLLTIKSLENFKRFRDGDYPDVQINILDILTPLLELSMRDETLAKDFFIIVFDSVKCHLQEFSEANNTSGQSSSYAKEESLNDFNLKSMCSALITLKRGIDVNLSSSFAEALLQICRMCINNCYVLNDFDTIINDSARTTGTEWLGKLILEEKKINDISLNLEENTKKIKLEFNIDVDSIDDDLYHLEYIKRWDLLSKLCDEATNDDSINQDLYLKYTEKYFECFVHLSDWEGFIETITNQCANNGDEVTLKNFDYDVLWNKPWTRDFILPLIFDANIFKLSFVNNLNDYHQIEKNEKKEHIECLEHFDNFVNNWSGDSEKVEYLNTKISSKFACWKTMLKLDTNSSELLKGSLRYLRNSWIQEYLSRKNKISIFNTDHENINSVLNSIQMLGEIYRFVDTSLKYSNTTRYDMDTLSKSFKKIFFTWMACLPTNHSDLTYWNLRLTQRSILISRLQETLRLQKNESTEEDEDLINKIIYESSLTQKMMELHLFGIAVQQSDCLMAEKYFKQIENYRCLTAEDDIYIRLQFIKNLSAKATRETDIENKINFFVDSWRHGENTRSRCDEDTNIQHYIDLIVNSAYNSYEIGRIPDICSHMNDESRSNVLKLLNFDSDDVDSDRITRAFSNYSLNAFKIVVKTSEKYAHQSGILKRSLEFFNNINAVENVVSDDSIRFLSETHMTVAKYFRKMKQHLENVDMTPYIIKNILKAIKYGSNKAKKMFPILLLELENSSNNSEIANIFKKEIDDIPIWFFTPWVSQLLAHLPTLTDCLLDLIVKLSSEYPQCVANHYRLSRHMWIMSNDKKMESVIKKLDELLLIDDIEKLVKALGGVCDPFVLFKMHLTNIKKAIISKDNNQLKVAFQDALDDVFPKQESGAKLRGSIYHQIRGNESCLKEIQKSCCADVVDVSKELTKINNFIEICNQKLKTLPSQKLISIGNFSPYLSSYGDSVVDLLNIFGQYDDFDTSYYRLQNLVKISKFESEVEILASMRRPIRISIIGSDGIKYRFLVKRGEDLRQDERIQQLFNMMNDSFDTCQMKINTYKVIPLSWDLGLIQWIDNCITLRDAIMWKKENNEKLNAIREKRNEYIANLPGNNMIVKYGNLTNKLNETRKLHLKILDKISNYYLRDAMLHLAESPDKFINMRDNYIRSLAPMNIAHWILGIGDRHLSNCLLSLHTGCVTGIDFDSAFGVATQMLQIPELMPFRLTPQLVNVLAPHGVKGDLRRLLIQALDKYKDNSELLLATMEVFVHEPAMNWMYNSREYNADANIKQDDKQSDRWLPREKINQCNEKLSGVIPIKITIEDLRKRTENQEFIENYCSIVKSSVDSLQLSSDQNTLTTSQQVDCLIKQATDIDILSVTYTGWEPWL